MVGGTAMFFSKDVYIATGGMDPGYFMFVEDADFCLRVARAGYGVYILPHLSVNHYHSYSVEQRPYSMILAHHRSLLRFFRLHRPLHFISYIVFWPFALFYISIELLTAFLKRPKTNG
jgi:GT2 family glycosyltransferase